ARLPYLYSAVCLTSLSASYTYHRDLHSFPTRRSSDLAGRARNTFTHNMYAHEEDQLRLDDLMTAGLKKQPHPRHIHQQRNAADGGAIFIAEQAAHGENFAIFHGDGGADVANGDDGIGHAAAAGGGDARDSGDFGVD